MGFVTSSQIPVLKVDLSVAGEATQIKSPVKFNYIDRATNTIFIYSGLIVDGLLPY